MSERDLFSACKKGDIFKVQYLIEDIDIKLNIKDKWDSTPLYYACLCGHEEVVQYLLEQGAKCEANTFEGERCLYGALTDRIRRLLRNHNAVNTVTIRRDVYDEFLRKVFDTGIYSDVEFIVHGQRIAAHRCIVSARCAYFETAFCTRWRDKNYIPLKNALITVEAFRALMQYIYTGGLDIHMAHMEDLVRLAHFVGLGTLVAQVQARVTGIVSFESTKPGVNVTTVTIEPETHLPHHHRFSAVCRDLGALADSAIPGALCDEADFELPFPSKPPPQLYPDVCFLVDGHHFMCHKVFVCVRSDYFRALLDDHFGEAVGLGFVAPGVPLVPVTACRPDVMRAVVSYVYQDDCQFTPDIAMDVLHAADLFLLPGLRRRCGLYLATLVDPPNAVPLLRTARMYALPRLQDACLKFMADDVSRTVSDDEFRELVLDDATATRNREEPDTIEIIDELRYQITASVATLSDVAMAEEKLAEVERMLDDLGLEA